MSKQYHLGDVLSVTDGHLLSPRGIEGVYDILSYMTGESLYTHALIRAAQICKPYILFKHKRLSNIVFPKEYEGNMANTENWLAIQIEKLGEWVDIEPLPEGFWEPIDPVEELKNMIDPSQIIIVDN